MTKGQFLNRIQDLKYIYIYIYYIYIYIYIYMNGLDGPSLDPGWDCMCFTSH